MWWVLGLLAFWSILAVVVGLWLGRSIKKADERESRR